MRSLIKCVLFFLCVCVVVCFLGGGGGVRGLAITQIEVLYTPASTQPGFKPMTSRLWQYMTVDTCKFAFEKCSCWSQEWCANCCWTVCRKMKKTSESSSPQYKQTQQELLLESLLVFWTHKAWSQETLETILTDQLGNLAPSLFLLLTRYNKFWWLV